MYPVPPNNLIALVANDEAARRRLQERDRLLRTEWTYEKVDPSRGPVRR